MIYAGILVSMGILALLVSVSGLFVLYVDILYAREEHRRRKNACPARGRGRRCPMGHMMRYRENSL